MVSLDTSQAPPQFAEPISSPRISFSCEFLDEKNFISISPSSPAKKEQETELERERNQEFEFRSSDCSSQTMLTADELFFEGKIIPFWKMQNLEMLKKISLQDRDKVEVGKEEANKKEIKVNWFVDDDPSPRPPKCSVLWKELLRLRKQRPSSFSPSSSSSSSSLSSSSSSLSIGDLAPIEEGKEESRSREKHVKRIKKGLERTRSTSIRIRPMISVPICTQGKNNNALPPMFSSLKKGA
ncbi:hypothetical protein U1Q18_031182 [Sarracenia purpurea var. burkii]